jgi:zinc protease
MNENHPFTSEFTIGESGRLFVAPTKAKDVVAIEGSVLGGENMLPKEWSVVPGLTAELLDAGTTRKSKTVIREGLAGRGISLSFAAGGDRTYFSGQCFPEDVPFLLSTTVECLSGANFPEAELKTLKQRTLGALAEEKTDTNAQAERALTELMYDAPHPNYIEPLKETEAGVKNARRSYLQDFRKMLGIGGLVLAVVGDVEVESVHGVVEKTFKKLPKGIENAPVKTPNKKNIAASQKLIPVADKANIDVFLGASLQLTKKNPLYHPAAILTDMLGGGFAGHLMQTVRERDGLTYRTYARLAGLSDGADGYFEVYASFNPGRYEESVHILRTEVGTFFSSHLTEEGINRKKDEITGSYLIGLATTRGLARALHSIGAEGRELSYLEQYPSLIRAISLAQVHKAADLIPLSKLSLAAAGTFPKQRSEKRD